LLDRQRDRLFGLVNVRYENVRLYAQLRSSGLGNRKSPDALKVSPTVKLTRTSLLVAVGLLASGAALGQIPVAANLDHQQLLASADPNLAANKQLVYDFWREVFEAGHMELAEKYLADSYVQHNPNVPTGRAAFVEFFQRVTKPKPIEPKVKAPLVAIVAEGDLVVLSFVSQVPDPKDAGTKYMTTWFDMFRIERGKIAEHWDPATKR